MWRLCLWPYRIWQYGFVDRLYAPALLRVQGGVCGKGLRLHGVPVVYRHRQASISLGDQVTLSSRPRANLLHLARPCLLAAIRPGATIKIGDNVGLSGVSIVAVSRIEIGDRAMIGAEALIADTDFHPLDPGERALHPTAGAVSRRILIGKDVFIGTRAMILKGVSIGDGAVVGAGAVVTKDVAAGDIVAGNPARIIGSVFMKSQQG
jgi:acetyltransferase-like isoleucine patch superfamily enzyme